jgi:glycosyltransferase involved in cell wall biosynthesis
MNITFIIPTIGRISLNNSINSLLNQTIENWNAIIIFDGIKSNIENNDLRIQIIEIDKRGLGINSAGNIRNYGMSICQTKWIAFLDDDDIIAPDYIETFYKELELYPNIDLLIFRMNLDERIIPKLETDNFYLCDVGISFIMKREIFSNGLKFIPDGAEDYLYLNKIRLYGYKIMISPYVKYFIKKEYIDIIRYDLGNRVFINMDENMNIITLLGYYMLTE